MTTTGNNDSIGHVNVASYGEIISENSVGNAVLAAVRRALNQFQKVEVDLTDVKSMATYNAKQIFGALYVELGPNQFYNQITLKGASHNISSIIRVGITDALREPAHA